MNPAKRCTDCCCTPSRARSAEELSARLNLVSVLLTTALESLTRHRLIAHAEPRASPPRYRYVSGPHDEALEALAQAYALQPIAVLRLLAASSIERIRAEALRTFADAFVFRKGK